MEAIKPHKKRDALENFEAQFKKSTLPLLVLRILSERNMYAYEISQIVYERSNGKYKMPLLYASLNKLQEQGFIEESEKIISEDNRLRVYYQITAEGINHLEKLKSLYADLVQTVTKIIYE